MKEWIYAQRDPSERLAQLHFFSVTKKQPEGDIEFLITVKEYVPSKDESMAFFAQADKHQPEHRPVHPHRVGQHAAESPVGVRAGHSQVPLRRADAQVSGAAVRRLMCEGRPASGDLAVFFVGQACSLG